MKKGLLFVLLMGMCWPLQAVLLIGHRGSNEGVENTLDAYRAGCERGYYGIETDIRVTKDGNFICCHDANLSAFGWPKVKIEKTTLKKLKSLHLIQTRWGKQEEGTLTTLEEYLDLCIEKNVVPVIELKSTTGINDKDVSMLPKLLEVVKQKNLLYTAVFISFNRLPLEYIRTHEDPTIQVQFLCMPHNEYLYFEWMKQYHIDLDICRGFSREMVQRYHDAGLKVNCWTIDDLTGAMEDIDFGVDMLTTNKLLYSDIKQ